MPNPNLVTAQNLLDILEDLKKHERIFHHPKFATENIDYEKMIDGAFWEVGASGRLYSRACK